MMLGKRGRYPMKRTTSMTEISYDDITVIVPPTSDCNNNHQGNSKVMGYVSPRPVISRRNSADYTSTTNSFLRTCSLCQRRLAPGRDIFMYRGDSAFCSLECRQQQMTQDEWKEKCTHTTHNKESNSSIAVSSAKAESIAAL